MFETKPAAATAFCCVIIRREASPEMTQVEVTRSFIRNKKVFKIALVKPCDVCAKILAVPGGSVDRRRHYEYLLHS